MDPYSIVYNYIIEYWFTLIRPFKFYRTLAKFVDGQISMSKKHILNNIRRINEFQLPAFLIQLFKGGRGRLGRQLRDHILDHLGAYYVQMAIIEDIDQSSIQSDQLKESMKNAKTTGAQMAFEFLTAAYLSPKCTQYWPSAAYKAANSEKKNLD
jgi:molybdenum-dependent DNA-binding transcriptional regulator ModE